MAGRKQGWIVEVAGLGRLAAGDALTDRSALAMTTIPRDSQPDAGTTRCDTYQPCLSRKSPVTFSGSTYSPVSGTYESGTATIRIELGTAPAEVAAFFLGSTRARSPLGLLANDFNVTDGSLTFEPYDPDASAASVAATLSDGDLLYLGREAVRVSSAADSGGNVVVTLQNTIPDPADPTSGVTRTGSGAEGAQGQIGTFITQHETVPTGAQPPFPDARVWRYNPFVAGREVTILRWNGKANTETVWWRGVVSGRPKVDSGSNTLTIKAADLIQVLRERRINEEAISYNVFFSQLSGERVPNIGMAGDPNQQADLEARSLYAGRSSRIVFQTGSNAYLGRQSGFDSTGIVNVFFPEGGAVGVFGSGETSPSEDLSGKAAFELLVSDPLDSESPAVLKSGQDAITASQHPLYATDAIDRTSSTRATTARILAHPIEIALALLGQYNTINLPAHWTLPLPSTWVDKATSEDLMLNQYSGITAWPGLILGKDGKPIEVLKALAQILGSIGVGVAITSPRDGNGGQIVFRSMFGELAKIQSAATKAHTLEGRPASLDLDSAADVFVIESGIGIDGKARALIVAQDLYRSGFFPYKSAELKLEAPGAVHPDSLDLITSLGSSTADTIVNVSRQLATLFRYPLQTATRRITYERPISPGEVFEFQDIGGRSDEDGSVLTETSTNRLALALKVAPDVGRGLTQTIDALVFPFAAKRIGPAALVDTGSTTTVINVERDVYWPPGSSYEWSDGNTIDDDSEAFSVGQEVVVIDQYHVVQTDPASISAVAATSITVSSALQATGGGTYTPSSGDIVVLADYTDSDAAEQGIYAYIDRDDWTL